ncbi:MAG: NADH-quinone oxidoreductase subunit C [Sphingomonas bacterium]
MITDSGERIRVVDVGTDVLAANAQGLHAGGSRLKMVYARRLPDNRIELRYVIEEPPHQGFTIWRCAIDASAPSLADIWPLLSWDEREIMELFGVTFIGHPDPRPLVRHAIEGAGPTAEPVMEEVPEPGLRAAGVLPEIEGAQLDVQMLPYGPVRAGVVESGAFFFSYVGEHILHYEPQLFFKHRGMEARFEGLGPEDGTVLAERISAVGSVAHALAYCQAIEAAAGCTVPDRAQWARVLLAEMERVYNHLHYLGHLADTTTLKVGHAEGMLLEEQAKRLNARLTGSRFLRNMLTPGGLRRDIDPGGWLAPALHRLRIEATRYADMLRHSDSFLDRLITTGPLPARAAFDQGATGPVARASGVDRDLRRDHPYAAYGRFEPQVAGYDEGDAHARFHVRVGELQSSLDQIQALLAQSPDGDIRIPCNPSAHAEGLGWAEGPRGAVVYAVHLDADARLSRVKVRSPSFSNWRAFPLTVEDSNMMDYAINEASFGLTIAGCDR